MRHLCRFWESRNRFSTSGAVYPHIKMLKISIVDSILGFAGQALLSSFMAF
jgi:hypothetical protein